MRDLSRFINFIAESIEEVFSVLNESIYPLIEQIETRISNVLKKTNKYFGDV